MLTNKEAWIVLNLLTNGTAAARIRFLVDFFGSPSKVLEQDASELVSLKKVDRNFVQKICRWNEFVDLDKELSIAEKGGVTILTPEEDDYPAPLKDFQESPVVLYVRGKIPARISNASLAIVGTRNVSNYGARMTRHISESAVYANWITVSGLAVGVDTIVHDSTVRAGGKTIGVLGGGFLKFHPKENLELARNIIETGGAVISEFPMEMVPTRYTFPIRNRIVSGLTCGTLVVEAGINSGSLITAGNALEQGKRVFALPGEADQPNFEGCHRLIRQGATLITNFREILEEFDFLPGFCSNQNQFQTDSLKGNETAVLEQQDENDNILSQNDVAILDALRRGPCSLDEISMKTSLPATNLISSLTALEIMHRIRKNLDGTYTKLR